MCIMIRRLAFKPLVRAAFCLPSVAVAATFATSVAHAQEMAAKEVATLAGGCFWCIEAVYNEMDGVESAISGYIGGSTKNPTYRDVCNGDTGHAEAVRITYDPSKLTFAELLDMFFTIHDPTQLNKQGNDHGTQYRSAIFYHTPEQKKMAEDYIRDKVQPKYKAPVVTTLEPATGGGVSAVWYPAEEYHQEYFRKEPYQPYVVGVVRPKVYKARDKFACKLKPGVKPLSPQEKAAFEEEAARRGNNECVVM